MTDESKAVTTTSSLPTPEVVQHVLLGGDLSKLTPPQDPPRPLKTPGNPGTPQTEPRPDHPDDDDNRDRATAAWYAPQSKTAWECD
jgi:hypothetical protein